MIGVLDMDIVKIKNGILLYLADKYAIYEMYADDTSQYYMCIANSQNNNYEMIIDFPEAYFDSLLKDDKLSAIIDTCDVLFKDYYPYIYILPNISTKEFKEAKTENDNHAYQILLRKLQKYTYDVFKSITSSNESIKLDNTIHIVVDTDDDKKFIDFLDLNLNGYFVPMKIKRNKENNDTDNEIPIIVSNNQGQNEIIKNNSKIKKLFPRDKKGFTSLAFITLTIIIALIIGISIGYLLVK